jgi:hypothetical protein
MRTASRPPRCRARGGRAYGSGRRSWVGTPCGRVDGRIELTAVRARGWTVTSAERVMDHLREDRGEGRGDGVLGRWGPRSPDVLGSGGPDRTAPGAAHARKAVQAGAVSVVARVGRGRDRLVAERGRLRTRGARSAPRTGPGACRGANPARREPRRPHRGGVGAVASISWAAAVHGFLKGGLRCAVVRAPRPRRRATSAQRGAAPAPAAQRLADGWPARPGRPVSHRSRDPARGPGVALGSQRGPAWKRRSRARCPAAAPRP